MNYSNPILYAKDAGGNVGLRVGGLSRLGPWGSWDPGPIGTYSIGYLRGLPIVESLPPNFGGGASKIRAH